MLQLPPKLTSEEVLGGRRIVLSRVLANKLGLEVGDSLTVDTSFDDAEFYLWSTSDEMAGDAAYIGLEAAQELADMPITAFNGLYLRVVPGHAQRIESRLYELRRTANVQLKSDIQHTWRSLMDLGYVFLGVMMGFALIMAFALLFNTMTVNVLEREREFATMRAMGSGRATTTLLMTAESLILWIVTLGPGLLLGYWVAHQMGKAFSSELLSFSVVIAPRSYLVTAGGVLVTMILAAWPAIVRVNRLNLAEATKIRP
jgi:putative ABC transport system permease protein